jgi:hypothetical protein
MHGPYNIKLILVFLYFSENFIFCHHYLANVELGHLIHPFRPHISGSLIKLVNLFNSPIYT